MGTISQRRCTPRSRPPSMLSRQDSPRKSSEDKILEHAISKVFTHLHSKDAAMKMFKRMDKNQDGTIDAYELRRALLLLVMMMLIVLAMTLALVAMMIMLTVMVMMVM